MDNVQLNVKRLLQYTTAAGAGTFLFAQASQAEVIHQAAIDGFVPTTISATPGGNVALDINNDGSDDVSFAVFSFPENGQAAGDNELARAFDKFTHPAGFSAYTLTPQATNNYYLYAFAYGDSIDATDWRGNEFSFAFVDRSGGQGINPMADELVVSGTGFYSMNQYNPTNGADYVGLEIIDGADSYFGWVQVAITGVAGVGSGASLQLSVLDYAWENTANTAILAGAVPEPSTYALGLGLLAAGAAGVRARRRKVNA